MRTKILLIDAYYITFIVIATLLHLVRGDVNMELLTCMPILFLIHGNITDVILYLILFINSIIAIFNFIWFWVYEVPIYIVNKFIILLYIFKPPVHVVSYIKYIFKPPIELIL